VKRGDLDPVRHQFRHHRIDLGVGEDEVAHHHHLSVAVRGEGQPGAERERGLEGDPVEHYVQIAARQTDPVDIPRHLGPGLADGGSNGLLPRLIGEGWLRKGEHARQDENRSTHHLQSPCAG